MTEPNFQLAASLICADMLELGAELERLLRGKIDLIHFDVMDGLFVPRFGLHPEILESIRTKTNLPVEAHVMIEDPERYIDLFAQAGAQYYTVHAEATRHLHRAVGRIKRAGLKAGVALNPATPLSVLDYLLDDIDLIMLMAINPGIVGHKLIPGAIEKIREAKAKIGSRPIKIEIDGGVTPESAPRMIEAGADILVCGTGSIFRPHEAPVDKKITQFRSYINQQLNQDLRTASGTPQRWYPFTSGVEERQCVSPVKERSGMEDRLSVLITTAGIGSRMAERTRTLNKCLIPIAGKPTIGYLIEHYPLNTRFVIVLGYLGGQVKDTLLRLYPDRQFEFVTVDPYDGPGSSQGFSELAAEPLLQRPFIYHACDTIIFDPIPAPDRNYAIGYKVEGDVSSYRTHKVTDGKLIQINDKGLPGFDYIHIGIAGFKDYAEHWRILRSLYDQDRANQKLNDTDVINQMIKEGMDFDFVPSNTWLDTGNPASFARAEEEITKHG